MHRARFSLAKRCLAWRALAAGLFLMLASLGSAASAQTLDRIAATKTVQIGFVAGQPPFSSKGSDGVPEGYAIDLCGVVVIAIAQRIEGVQARYVETTVADAFEAVASGRIDLLCGAITGTLTRRETVDFSEPIFLTGMSALLHEYSRRDLRELFLGKREVSPPRSPEMTAFASLYVGVRVGTTTESVLREAIATGAYQAIIIGYANHADGLAALESREIDAYFADRGLLIGLLGQARNPSSLILGTKIFSREPYAIAMRRGDADLRLLVDRALTEFYGTPQFAALLNHYFREDAGEIEAQVISLSIPK